MVRREADEDGASRCSNSQPINAPVASDGYPIFMALERKATSSAKLACGVSREVDCRPIFSKGLRGGNQAGFERETAFQALRAVFMA